MRQIENQFSCGEDAGQGGGESRFEQPEEQLFETLSAARWRGSHGAKIRGDDSGKKEDFMLEIWEARKFSFEGWSRSQE